MLVSLFVPSLTSGDWPEVGRVDLSRSCHRNGMTALKGVPGTGQGQYCNDWQPGGGCTFLIIVVVLLLIVIIIIKATTP